MRANDLFPTETILSGRIMKEIHFVFAFKNVSSTFVCETDYIPKIY